MTSVDASEIAKASCSSDTNEINSVKNFIEDKDITPPLIADQELRKVTNE